MGAAASLTDENQARLCETVKEHYDAVNDPSRSNALLLEEIKTLLREALAEQNKQQHRNQSSIDHENEHDGDLNQALSSYLEIEDDASNFKIGDVVRACPPTETLKCEGVLVSVLPDHVSVDFGDDEPPSLILKTEVQRVQNGQFLEEGDVVQAKSVDSPVYCLGKIHSINLDGSYNVIYDGVDEIDYNIDMNSIRKIGSGRSSIMTRFKKAASAVIAARAFAATSTGVAFWRDNSEVLETIIGEGWGEFKFGDEDVDGGGEGKEDWKGERESIGRDMGREEGKVGESKSNLEDSLDDR